MRALVIGGYGFVGRHLAQHLVSCGDDVALTYTVDRRDDVISARLLKDQGEIAVPRVVQSMALDITDADAVSKLVSLLKPDVIYHLAALSFVPDAEKSPSLAFSVNTTGTINIVEAIKSHSPETRLLFVGTSQSYGTPRPGVLPITENSELRPGNVYALTKTYADLACYTSVVRDSLHIVRVRPFQHTGPGQSPIFAISSFAKQVAQIKLGKAPPQVSVGNLDIKRDYCDVSDIARGYREAALNGKSGEVYNFSFGQSVSLDSLLRLLITRAGIDIEIVVDPARVRPVEAQDVYGTYAKAHKEFGWRPRVSHEAMLDSLLTQS